MRNPILQLWLAICSCTYAAYVSQYSTVPHKAITLTQTQPPYTLNYLIAHLFNYFIFLIFSIEVLQASDCKRLSPAVMHSTLLRRAIGNHYSDCILREGIVLCYRVNITFSCDTRHDGLFVDYLELRNIAQWLGEKGWTQHWTKLTTPTFKTLLNFITLSFV